MKYSQERKQAVLAKLAPPHQRTVKDVGLAVFTASTLVASITAALSSGAPPSRRPGSATKI